jgi:ATP-dependent Clp protease ATP-binding subunit ClpC
MFEKYTEKARRVIFFARYEAGHFGSLAIEPEHLLLGLLREDKELASRLSKVEDIRKEIEARTPIREKAGDSEDMPFSEESKRILENASNESERHSHPHISMEHILLGFLREEKSFAAEILKKHGLDPET